MGKKVRSSQQPKKDQDQKPVRAYQLYVKETMDRLGRILKKNLPLTHYNKTIIGQSKTKDNITKPGSILYITGRMQPSICSQIPKDPANTRLFLEVNNRHQTHEKPTRLKIAFKTKRLSISGAFR